MTIYPVHRNETGSFQELARENDVKFGQLSILTIEPGCTRGNHYHERKEEWFCCIHGRCRMDLKNVRNGSERSIIMSENDRTFHKVNPFESHIVTNVDDQECELLIIISEEYDPDDPDTFKPEEG